MRQINHYAAPRRFRRRGSVLIYTFYLMTIFLAMISFAVDFAHMETVKTELQRSADLSARGSLQLAITYGQSYANTYGPYLSFPTYNPVDGPYGTAPTTVLTWGTWNEATQTFSANTGYTAVKITICRTTATNNPVKLTFPLMTGKVGIRQTCDVWAMAIAYLSGATTSSQSVSGQSDPWLAGMPNGSTASDNDQSPAQNPLSVMNVTPGQVLTFTNVSGGVKHDPALNNDTAGGDPTQMHNHNDDDPMNESAVQNGIGDIRAPIDSLIGLFIGQNAPNTMPAPTVTRDYSTQAARDVVQTTDIQSQQPFYIGTGKNSGGTTQTFVVPNGATRLYLGTMDGHQWANNSGSYAVTVNLQQQILLVK